VREALEKLIEEFGTFCGDAIRRKDEARLTEFQDFLGALKQAIRVAERDVENALREVRQETVH